MSIFTIFIIRETGDWEIWIDFFLRGTIHTANQATETAIKIYHLFDENRKRIETLGKPTASVLKLHHYLEMNPITSMNAAVSELKISLPTVNKSFGHLIDLGIVKEITGKKRHKIFVYEKYLNLLSEGVEPIR